MLSTPPTSFQSAQLTRPTARAASSMSAVGPHEPTTIPLGRLEPSPFEYALRTPVITLCNVSTMSGRPGRMYIPGGSAVRGTRGGRAETRVQWTLKRREREACGDARGCMSGVSSGSRAYSESEMMQRPSARADPGTETSFLTWVHDRPYNLDNTYMTLAIRMLLQHVIKDAHNIWNATATSDKDCSRISSIKGVCWTALRTTVSAPPPNQ